MLQRFMSFKINCLRCILYLYVFFYLKRGNLNTFIGTGFFASQLKKKG